MKNLTLVLVFLFCGVISAVAQRYQMTVSFGVMNSNNNVKCSSHVRLTFFRQSTSQLDEWYEEYNISEDDWVYYNKTFTFNGDDPVVRIAYESKRFTKNLGGCRTEDERSGDITIDLSDYPCNSISKNGLFASTDNYVNIRIRPQNPYSITAPIIGTIKYDGTPIDYLENGTVSTTNVLPLDNNITLSAHTAPNASETSGYGWQYKIDGSDWNYIPSGFGHANTVTFSGRTLFNALGIDPQLYLFKNVFFRAIYIGCVDGYTYECLRYDWMPCTDCPDGAPYEYVCVETASNPIYNEYTSTYTLQYLPSAPHILSIDPIQETCYDFQDAQLKIHFDRALYPNETLTIFKKKSNDPGVPEAKDMTSLDSDNIATIINLTPNTINQTYDISLLSNFHSPTNVNVSLGTGYSNGTNHFGTAYIKPRDPVTFTATPQDVHCFGGKDGKIVLTASGGTASYTANLFKKTAPAALLNSCNFTDVAGNNFLDLPKEEYVVRLTDSHGCIYKLNGSEVIPPAPINEPTARVVLSAVEAIEPLGFGLQNGHITVRSEYGVSPYTFNWTDGSNNMRTPDASVVEGASMTSTLGGLGKGHYHVVAKDNQYALANPQIEINLSGCYDTISIDLDQPPLLEVSTDQYHYVSCHGYDDGEIVAHAKGGRPYLAGNTYHPYQYEWYTVKGTDLSHFGTSDSIAIDRPSAVYRVKVTDRNGIIAWSTDFDLIQPDTLAITFNTSILKCNGDTDGTSHATIVGGTPGYTYAWSTEETTNEIRNLRDGWYSLIVTDTRRCTTFGQTEVIVPNSLKADSLIDYPTCNGYTDGSIALTVSGGIAPYSYDWNNHQTTAEIDNLGEGDYHVRISDVNHCFIEKDYSMQDPAAVPVNLGPDRVLCKGQTFAIDVTRQEPTTYAWLKNNEPFSSSPTVELTETGTYQVTTTDDNGCKNEDAIKIERDDTEISSSIIVATRAPVGGKIRIANISYPVPDSVRWTIPKEATIVEKTTGYLDIMFIKKGKYPISLTSFKGLCEVTSFDTIRVVDKSDLTDYQTPEEPYIKQFMVTPNPSDGHFVATVELREQGDYQLLLISTQSTIVRRVEITGQTTSKTEFDVSSDLGKGIYVLQLITSQGYATFKVLIQ